MSEEESRCFVALNTAISLVPSECTDIQEFVMHFGVNIFGLRPEEIPTKQTCRLIFLRSLTRRDYKKILAYVLCCLFLELEKGKTFQEAINTAWTVTKRKIGE